MVSKFKYYNYHSFLKPEQDAGPGSTHLSESSTLILERVDRHHAGFYQCAADNGVRDPIHVDIELTVLCKYTN